MDPNEALRRIRAAITAYAEAGGISRESDEADELIDMFQALDEWLSKGGFLPAPWEWAERRATLVQPRTQIHKAAPDLPGERGGPHCTTCGQVVRQVPGGQGMTWVHSDSGAVAAPNPPSVTS